MNVIDITGSTGVFFILLAYFLNIGKYVSVHNKCYLILNVIGSFMAALASYLMHYWPFIILEGSWLIISLIGLIKSFYGFKQGNSHGN